jgi:hypothetical protein
MTQPIVFPVISDLSIVGVYDAGVPNAERVYLRAHFDVSLAEYFLMTGYAAGAGFAVPLTDVFWLGPAAVTANTWLVIYTGPGQDHFTAHQGDPLMVRHWGKPTTLFNVPTIVPVLFHTDAVQVGNRNLPATRQLKS